MKYRNILLKHNAYFQKGYFFTSGIEKKNYISLPRDRTASQALHDRM